MIHRPSDLETLGSRIALKNKYKVNGFLQRMKARLVAQGFSQKPGVHFNQTFSLVARLSSIRLVIALAVQYNMKIHQIDAASVY